MLFIDLLMLAAGAFLLVAPDKAMNFGKAEKGEFSKKALIAGRIFGLVVVVVSGLFLYFGQRA